MWLVALALCSAFVLAVERDQGVAQADTKYRSRLGFTVSLPTGWVALDPTVGRNLSEVEADPRFSAIDPAVRRSVLEKIWAGEFEFLFRKPVIGGFAQGIGVRPRTAAIPAERALPEHCRAFARTLRDALGKEIVLAVCELRSVAGHRATYVEHDGPSGTLTLQYQVERHPGSVIAFTGTTLTDTQEAFRGEFESIVHSIEFQSPRH